MVNRSSNAGSSSTTRIRALRFWGVDADVSRVLGCRPNDRGVVEAMEWAFNSVSPVTSSRCLRAAGSSIVYGPLKMRDGLQFSSCLVQGLAQPRIFVGLCRQATIGGQQLVARVIMRCLIPQALVFSLQNQLLLDVLQGHLGQESLRRQQSFGPGEQFGQLTLRGDGIGGAVARCRQRQRQPE